MYVETNMKGWDYVGSFFYWGPTIILGASFSILIVSLGMVGEETWMNLET